MNMSCGEPCSRSNPCTQKGKSCCRNCVRYHLDLKKIRYKEVFVRSKDNKISKFENCTMEDIHNNMPNAEFLYFEEDIENTFDTSDIDSVGDMMFTEIESSEWSNINKNQSLREFKVNDINNQFFEYINQKFKFKESVLNEVASELIDSHELVKADRYFKFLEKKISRNLNEVLINRDRDILELYTDVKYKRAIIISTIPGNQESALSKMQEARDVEKMVNAIIR